MTQIKDMTGQRFGRLVVKEMADVKGQARWLCVCDCGTERVVYGSNLRDGKSASCGCYLNEQRSARFTKHGMSRHRRANGEKVQGHELYNAWQKIRERCYNPNCPAFSRYGGRGIVMHETWRTDFVTFAADVGDRPKGCSIDRINNDGNYEPGNVRWATPKEQANNRGPVGTLRQEVKELKEENAWLLSERAALLARVEAAERDELGRAVHADVEELKAAERAGAVKALRSAAAGEFTTVNGRYGVDKYLTDRADAIENGADL